MHVRVGCIAIFIFSLELTSYNISRGRLDASKLKICIFYFLLILRPIILACVIFICDERMLPHVFPSIICAGNKSMVAKRLLELS